MNTLVKFLQDAIVNDRTIQNQYAEHYQFFNKIEVAIQQAWRIWDDKITSTYYEGSEKPEEPTPAFELDWIENEDFEADGFDLTWVEQLVGNSKNMTIE